MAIDTITYPTPVRVHGFSCKNCSEVDLAARNIDPVHLRSGPNNINAASDPTRNAADPVKIAAVKDKALAANATIVGYSKSGLQAEAINPGSAFAVFA